MRPKNGWFITEDEFRKEPIPAFKFKELSVWDWLYEIIKLIKDVPELLKMWQRNFIKGFIGKKETFQLLQQCENGTFLLRFSESVKGMNQ